MSGLKNTLRTEVQAARPKTVTEAIGLARLYEARLGGFKKYQIHEDRRSGKDPPPPLPSTTLNRTKTPATRRLSAAEMQDRRSRGLCFNCDERFLPGHRCKQLFVIEGIYTDEGEEEEPLNTGETEEEEPIISLHALTGSPNPQTMHVRGSLGKVGVTVLMDSGSTHSFINPKVVHRLKLIPKQTGRMQVTVANGEKLICTGLCAGLLIWLQGEPFAIDFFVLPMDVCEVVIGTQWLRTLGPIWWDFERLWMRFMWKGRDVELMGIKPPLHRMVEVRVMERESKE